MTSGEKYALLDKLQLCHRCEKAKPALGRKFCWDCLERIRAYNNAHYDKVKAQQYNERRRELYAEKKAAGICVRCKKPATHGLYCYECAIKAKRHNAQTALKRRIARQERGLIPQSRRENGLCVQCGKLSNGAYYCTDCLEDKKKALDLGRENSPFMREERIRYERVVHSRGSGGQAMHRPGIPDKWENDHKNS